MPKRKTLEIMSICGLFLQLAFVVTCYALYSRTRSQALLAQTWFMTPGLFMWLVTLLHGRQRRLAETEREEMQRLRRERLSEEIFEEQELDRMRAGTGLRIFEKYLVPAFSVLLSAALGFLCYRNINAVLEAGPSEMAEPLASVAGMASVTFFGFLMGKYVSGLSHGKGLELLRAPASYLMGNVMTGLLLVVALTMVHFGVEWLETAAAYIVPGFMGVIAFEVLLNMILDIYRPRVSGRQWRPAYDSRLLNLCAEPAGVFETFAAMLDYQFGFRISETWLYSFMQRAIIPLIIIQIFALWSLSALVVIQPGEAAFIERWGRPKLSAPDRRDGLRASVYRPGFHLKLPWPIETVQRFEADRIHGRVIGKLLYEDVPGISRLYEEMEEEAPLQRDEDVILWRELHVDPEIGREAEFLVPSIEGAEAAHGAPALNIVRMMARVHYRIRRGPDGSVDPDAAHSFYYRHTDPHSVLENLAMQTICRIAASQNFLRWIHVERADVSRRFAAALQESADRNELGVELVYAGLPSVHPPAGVSAAFESVINAYEQKESMIHEGEREAVVLIRGAEGEAAGVLNRARAYSYRLKQLSEAEQQQFSVRLEAFQKSPEVYRLRQYFSSVEEALAGHRLYIVPVTEKEINIIDMKGRRPADILDIDLEDTLR